MTRIVGSWRAPGGSLLDLARTLMYAPEQRLLHTLQEAEVAAAQVGHTPTPGAFGRGPALSWLLAGEVLGLEGDLTQAYARDPSWAFLRATSGVYAGVLLDTERLQLLLFSDPLGLGPLYYALEAGQLVFSSEQKSFARLPGRTAQLEDAAADEFVRHGHLLGDRTWLAGVQLLPPGHTLRLDLRTGQAELRAYYDLAREERPRYASFGAAKQAVSEAYQAAFARVAQGCVAPRVLLGGDLDSRMLLAATETAQLQPIALTATEPDSEDACYAQRACAVRNTPQRAVALHATGWLLARAALGYVADGVDLGGLTCAPLQSQLAGRSILDASLGEIALGTRAIRGFDDLRLDTLLRQARREFTRTRAHATFGTSRFVFADARLWRAALGAEVAYLLSDRLRNEVSRELFPDYFKGQPVATPDSVHKRLVFPAQAVHEATYPELPKAAPIDPYGYLRADSASERFLWELLSDPGALYAQHVDRKLAHAAFFQFFQDKKANPGALLRYASLEIWLRQLFKGEFLPATPPAPAPTPAQVTTPEVSVIVPAYNVQDYLAECLNSLCNQELTSLEILVVNDGSTDGTQAVIERFAAADARIVAIETPNMGVYHARNRALERARGRYISFVDADDYTHPSMLAQLVEAADARGAEVAFCDVFQLEEGAAPSVRRNTLRFKPGVELCLSNTPLMIADGFSTLWNRIYDRAFLEREGLKFDERFRISADMLFLQQLLAKASSIVRVPRALYFYRLATPKSLTSYEVRNAKYLVHLEITIELIDFWVRNGLFERYAQHILLRALRNFLWNTHIDEPRLREVFDKLHAYLKPLRVDASAVAKLPPFERQVFQLLRAGDFGVFLRAVRRYRAKMIESKGGQLTGLERWAKQLDKVRAGIKRRVGLAQPAKPKSPEPAKPKPAASQLKAPVAASLADDEGTPKKTSKANGRALGRVRERLGVLRQRVFFEGDLDKALAHKKPRGRRILHFSNGFSVPSETFTYDVITGLEQGTLLDNYVMCFDRQLVRERPFDKTIELVGATRRDLETANPRAMRKIKLVLDRLQPDLIHCHFGWVGIPLVTWLARTKRRTPVVITMHGTDVNMWPARHAFYADALKAVADKPWVWFSTHTHTYREKLERLGVPSARIEVIPNSFDPRFAEGGATRHRFQRGEHLRIISVARMDIWKGHSYLIDGFAQLVRTHYENASLTLVGYGPEEEKLKAQVAALGLSERVRFFGRAQHHQVPVLLRNHDVYVQPSIKHPETLQEEGQPIAVLEAIATGMPVIVTDTGGMAETVKVGDYSGQAWVVPDKSAAALADALAQLIDTPSTPEAQAAYVRGILEKHARGAQLADTQRLYENAWGAAGQGFSTAATMDQEVP